MNDVVHRSGLTLGMLAGLCACVDLTAPDSASDNPGLDADPMVKADAGSVEGLGGMAHEANQPPAVSAGPDRVALELNTPTPVTGVVEDDGLGSGPLQVAWSSVSGPAPVQFQGADTPVATVTFPVEGTYVLRLSANDGLLQASDDVTLRVLNLGTSLLAHLPMDEGTGFIAQDRTGNQHHGIFNTKIGWTTGHEGHAIDTSEGACMTLNYTGDQLAFGTQPFAISLWFKTGTKVMDAAHPAMVYRKAEKISDIEFLGYELFVRADDALVFQMWSNKESAQVFVQGLIDNAWHHVVTMRTPDKIALYVDGELAADRPQALRSISTLRPLSVGCDKFIEGTGFSGAIDDLRVYGRVLTAEEIRALAGKLVP